MSKYVIYFGHVKKYYSGISKNPGTVLFEWTSNLIDAERFPTKRSAKLKLNETIRDYVNLKDYIKDIGIKIESVDDCIIKNIIE